MTVAPETWAPALRDDPSDIDAKQTGDLGAMVVAATTRRFRLIIGATGAEYGDEILRRFHTCAGARTSYELVHTPVIEGMADQAPGNEILRIALQQPHVAVEPPQQPEPTDNPIDEACAISGLTRREVADLLGLSERYVMRLRHSPEALGWGHESRLNALRTIGGALVGGLGRRRTAEWLRHGDPSPLDLIREGRTDEVLEIARRVRA